MRCVVLFTQVVCVFWHAQVCVFMDAVLIFVYPSVCGCVGVCMCSPRMGVASFASSRPALGVFSWSKAAAQLRSQRSKPSLVAASREQR